MNKEEKRFYREEKIDRIRGKLFLKNPKLLIFLWWSETVAMIIIRPWLIVIATVFALIAFFRLSLIIFTMAYFLGWVANLLLDGGPKNYNKWLTAASAALGYLLGGILSFIF